MAKGPSFEQAMRELEDVVSKLEGDELTLQQALEYFENGVKLMRVCDTHLKSAEGKLKELLKGEDGEFVEKILGMTLESVVGNEEFED